MEPSEIKCKIIAACNRGHEKAVLRDILDLLFPYDAKVTGKIIAGGKLCFQTSLNLETIALLFRRYPIRNLLSLRYILSMIPARENILDGIIWLLEENCKNRKLFRKISVRIKGSDGWRQEYFDKIKVMLKECQGGILDGILEYEGGNLLLEAKVPLINLRM